jgi:hypothetical protein
MNKTLKPEDIYDVFHSMTEIEIHAATSTIKAGEEKDQLMGQGYILAVERCPNILRSIMKDVPC